MDPGSVTRLIPSLKGGEAAAIERIWQRYYDRLVRLSRNKLPGERRAADEEDVALAAFDSFYRGAKGGRFPQLSNRNELWALLIVIATRKAAKQKIREARLKRGGGRVRGDSALEPAGDDGAGGLDALAGREFTPEWKASVAEQFQARLAQLDDDLLRKVALQKLEGFGNAEIAQSLGCTERTVERKLNRIRALWTDELLAVDPPRPNAD